MYFWIIMFYIKFLIAYSSHMYYQLKKVSSRIMAAKCSAKPVRLESQLEAQQVSETCARKALGRRSVKTFSRQEAELQ